MITVGNSNLDEDKLRLLYCLEKKSSADIAKIMGTTKRNVLKALDIMGVEKRKPNTYPQLNRELLKELYINQKLSARTIAETIGCSKNLVNKRLHKFGIPIRMNAGDPSFTVQERKEKWGKKEKDHPRWKGGVTKVSGLIRNRLSYLSEECLKRDEYLCVNCGNPRNLHAHHLRPFSEILQEILKENPQIDLLDEESRLKFVELCENDKRLTDLENLTTLCENCHHNEHTDRPIKIVNYDILEKQWREFIRENHLKMSVSEMGLKIKVLPYRIITFMKKENLLFSYQDKDWLGMKLKKIDFISSIAREFHSQKYPCYSENIREYAVKFGYIYDFEEKYTEFIIKAYSEGQALKKIASKINSSQKRLTEILMKNGIEIKNKRIRDDILPTEAVKMFKEGKKVSEIANHFNASKQTITYILRNNGIDDTSSNHLRHDIDVLEMTKMYVEKGMNIKAIAKHFNSSSRTISNKLKEAGIDVVNSSALRRISSQVVLSLFKQGVSVVDIANLNSKSHDVIKMRLENSGIIFPTQSNKVEGIDNDILLELYNTGASVKDLCIMFKCSDTTICTRLASKGVSFEKKIDIESIITLYNQGLSVKKVANKTGISEITIQKYLVKNGVEVKSKNIREDLNSKEVIKDLERLYLEGKSMKEIAVIYNCSDTLVGQKLKIRKPKLKDYISKEELHQLYVVENKGFQEIADIYNTSRGGIWKLAKNYGLLG
ncbi:helix-turn-helix domain-containing protein [Bacillus mycoides]|uniref:helix-turn-helix domain-containing protein n=1 Tax=Bacillus mycoides TaxID=1405 RepID=UPI001C5FCC08|nr:helix-turn-helix domain-containing protein [Bacillus mycoides]